MDYKTTKPTILLMMSRKAVELFVCDEIGETTEKTSAKPALKDGVNFLQQHVPELGRTCKIIKNTAVELTGRTISLMSDQLVAGEKKNEKLK